MKDREFIKYIAEVYAELRSDVSEACYEQLQRRFKKESFLPEHRFIQARIPKTDIIVEYDTLTTELSHCNLLDEVWQDCCEHEYISN